MINVLGTDFTCAAKDDVVCVNWFGYCSINIDATYIIILCYSICFKINVDITVNGVNHQGTLICPSCTEMCYVS